MKKFMLGFLVGAILFSSVPISATIEEFICYRADYKVLINGEEYISEDLPVLNYKGNTYAPFRSILEKAGLDVNWNAELGQAEVSSPTNAQIFDGEGTTMTTDTVKYTPDGIKAWLDQGRYTVSMASFKARYKDTEFAFIHGDKNGQYSIAKNGEVILENVEFIKGTFLFDYDYYVNTILPLLQ